MLYLVSVTNYRNRGNYLLVETDTESFIGGDEGFINRIASKIKVKNMSITKNGLVVKPWCNSIRNYNLDRTIGSEYILLCKINENTFKLTSNAEKMDYVDTIQLKKYIQKSMIANCTIQNGEYKSMDTYDVIRDTQFEENIHAQYERHVAMTAMLGRKATFNYIIEGSEVKLKRYTGSSKEVIVPKFITSIMARAFMGIEISSVILESGLKSIGSLAFNGCELSKITIPSTVEFIGLGAIYGNERLSTARGLYRDTVIILNKNATIIDDYVL